MSSSEPSARFPNSSIALVIAGITSAAIVSASAYYVYSSIQHHKPAKLHRSGAIRRRSPRPADGEPPDNYHLHANNPSIPIGNVDGVALDIGPPPEGDNVTEQSLHSDDDANQVAANQLQSSLLKQLALHTSTERQMREGMVHRGINCDECNATPIRGIRYRCMNCEDFDLCEMCEAMNNHIRTHVFMKIRIPTFWNMPKATPTIFPGKPLELPSSPPESVLADVRSLLHTRCEPDVLSEYEIQGTYQQFTCLADVPDNSNSPLPLAISRRAFRSLFPMTQRGALVFNRIFQAANLDPHLDTLSFASFVHLVLLTTTNDTKYPDRRRILFSVFDLDNDGLVSRDDFLALFNHMHDITEDITLHHLAIDNASEDFRRLEETATARDFTEGVHPLPNYFSVQNVLHAGRPYPIFGAPHLSDKHVPGEDLDAGHQRIMDPRGTAREFAPQNTPAAKFIRDSVQSAFNELLDPFFKEEEDATRGSEQVHGIAEVDWDTFQRIEQDVLSDGGGTPLDYGNVFRLVVL